MATVKRVPSADKLEDFVKEALEAKPSVLILYLFGDEAEDGKSWCGDCVEADPWIRNAIKKKENSYLLEIPVGDRRSFKGVADNPYRVHDMTKISSIPTAIRWGPNGAEDRLEESTVSEEAINKLVGV